MLLDAECCQHLSDMSSAVNRRLDYHVEEEEWMDAWEYPSMYSYS